MPKKFALGTVKFMREVLVVMLGLTISFSINTCVNNRKERKDISQYLHAIYSEMDRAIATIEYFTPSLERELELIAYLRDTEKDSWCFDFIEEFRDVFATSWRFQFRTVAFEMFEKSGMLRLISDRNLAMSILDLKNMIDIVNSLYEDFITIKQTKQRQFGRDGILDTLLEYYTIERAPLFIHGSFVNLNTRIELLKQQIEETKYMR